MVSRGKLKAAADDPEALNRRGLIRKDLGDLSGAKQDYDKALRLDPNDGAVLNNRARLLEALGKTAEALADCERTVVVRPKDPVLWHNFGFALRTVGNRRRAIEVWRKGLSVAKPGKLAERMKGAIAHTRARLEAGNPGSQ